MYHNISKVVIAVLTVSLLISVAIAQDTTSSYEALDDCFISMPEGADYDCGYVTVPEFHDGRNENTISLGVIRLRSSSDTPEAPIFFGAGGPGGSVMRWAPATASEVLADPSTSYGQILETRDLIYFTQRGTQFADPFLSCPEEEAAQAELAQPGTFDEHLRIQIDALTACHDRLVAEGVNFDAYNSLENAADINAIREVFGYETIVYYGESYGTILGQHVMRDFPDILESVILDGTASLSMTDWEEDSARKYQITLERVIALCEGSPDCNENFPNFADNINAAFEQALNYSLTVELFVGGELLDVPVTAEVLSSTI